MSCDRGPFDTKNGAVMHAINARQHREDDRITRKPEAYEALEGTEQPYPCPFDALEGETTGAPSPDGGLSATGRQHADLPEVEDVSEDEPDTADCPNCGSDLAHTEEEVEEFIEEHGAAYCDTCGHRIRV